MNRFGALFLVFSAFMTAWVGANSLKSRRDKKLEKTAQSLYTIYRCGDKTTSRLSDFIGIKFPGRKARLFTSSPEWFDRRVPFRIQIGTSNEASQSFHYLAEPDSKSLTPIDGASEDVLKLCRLWADSL